MAIDSFDSGESAIDRWDTLHQVLASQKRRMVVYALLDAPEGRRVPLPEAAMAPGSSSDYEKMTICLQQYHLPQMADAGYVRWERDPFCVQRGPRFGEVEAVFDLIHESIDEFPKSLIQGCEIYEEMHSNVQS